MVAGKRVGAAGAAQAALVLAGLFIGATAGAADWRIGLAPAWIKPVAFDAAAAGQANAANVAYGTRFDVIDDQVRLTSTSRVRYHHIVSEAVTAKGIDQLSHQEIQVDPGWETLTLAQLDIVRDGHRVSRLRDVQVKVLQRERDLDSRIYDGRKSIAFDLSDVRVGDVLEFAYVRTGANPVFAGHHGGAFDMRLEVPVAHLYRRLSTAAGMPLAVAQRNGAPAPQVSQVGGFDERVWDLRDQPGLRMEASTPSAYDPFPWAEWSTFASWGDVARWAEPLYQVAAPATPALRAEIDAIAKQTSDPAERVMAVLRLVQGQVRYLGVEIGAGTHAPSAPNAVWARRWGDCKEKSLLMVTMLRELGIAASPVLVNTDRGDALAADLPNANAFDHVITRVSVAGADYWLDATLAPQQGTLHTVSQPDYGQALVLDGRATALTKMPEATPARHAREVRIDVDSSEGLAHPVKYDVRTTYHGFAADRVRHDLGDGERGELQHRYVNFYASSYPGIQVAAPIEVQDDARANTVVVTEHYRIKDFWPVDAKGRQRASFHVPEIDGELKVPEETIRTMPLAIAGPQSVHEQVRVRLPLAWPERKWDRAVVNDAFKLHKSVQVHGRDLTTDYLLEYGKDQVDANAVQAYAADINRAQGLLGDSLSTADADATIIGAGGALALKSGIGLVALLLAGWWGVGLRRTRSTPAARG